MTDAFGTEPADGVSVPAPGALGGDSDRALVAVSEVVRRVVAARVRSPHLVEDLTQSVLLKVAASARSLDDDALQAYAIVTARNIVIEQARAEAVHARHAHRLVEFTSLEGPDALVLRREETDALAAALQMLDPVDREMLLRHEVHGDSVEVLAANAQTSSSAMKMRLARARAVLRVEFLLAFRQASLPTVRCRPVLMAYSTGDRRRQAALGASSHLRGCPTCAGLVDPVSQRRRSLAGWLILPAGAAVRRAVERVRGHGRSLTIAGGIGALAVIVLVVATTIYKGSGEQITRPPSASGAGISLTASSSSSAAPVATPALPTTTAVPVTTTSAASAPCPSPAPTLDVVDPHAVLGCPIAATVVTVTDVPTDEGFWAVTSSGQEVWVQLVGSGESPFDVNVGDVVRVAGIMAPVAELDPASVGPDVAAAGAYLRTKYAELTPV